MQLVATAAVAAPPARGSRGRLGEGALALRSALPLALASLAVVAVNAPPAWLPQAGPLGLLAALLLIQGATAQLLHPTPLGAAAVLVPAAAAMLAWPQLGLPLATLAMLMVAVPRLPPAQVGIAALARATMVALAADLGATSAAAPLPLGLILALAGLAAFAELRAAPQDRPTCSRAAAHDLLATLSLLATVAGYASFVLAANAAAPGPALLAVAGFGLVAALLARLHLAGTDHHGLAAPLERRLIGAGLAALLLTAGLGLARSPL
jgi:hypothetical protein